MAGAWRGCLTDSRTPSRRHPPSKEPTAAPATPTANSQEPKPTAAPGAPNPRGPTETSQGHPGPRPTPRQPPPTNGHRTTYHDPRRTHSRPVRRSLDPEPPLATSTSTARDRPQRHRPQPHQASPKPPLRGTARAARLTQHHRGKPTPAPALSRARPCPPPPADADAETEDPRPLRRTAAQALRRGSCGRPVAHDPVTLLPVERRRDRVGQRDPHTQPGWRARALQDTAEDVAVRPGHLEIRQRGRAELRRQQARRQTIEEVGREGC